MREIKGMIAKTANGYYPKKKLLRMRLPILKDKFFQEGCVLRNGTTYIPKTLTHEKIEGFVRLDLQKQMDELKFFNRRCLQF